MQKADAQRNHTRSEVRQGKGASLDSPQGERIAQFEAMAESSPQADKLAQLAVMVDASLAMAAQRKFIGQVHNSPAVALQRKAVNGIAQRAEVSAKPNSTGLPDNLKNGIESLSGMSMDNVRVHYNSSQPAQLNALAYAQGTDIHVAPGQEQHLPHEAWHVVQQAQGRVKPTMQMKGGVPVNDDAGLEREADAMGARAASVGVVQGKSIESDPIDIAAAENPASIQMEQAGPAPQSAVPVVQRRNFNQLSGTQSAQIGATADGIYYQYAPQFETAVGAAAFVHPDANQAATVTANNYARLLAAFAGAQANQRGESDAAKQDRYLTQHLGSRDREPAGSIGSEANQIRAALARGNLREHLTLMYNTMSDGKFGTIVQSFLTNAAVQQNDVNNAGFDNALGTYQHIRAVATSFNINNAGAANPGDFLPRANANITDTRGVRRRQTRDLPARHAPDGEDAFGNPMMAEIDYNTFQVVPGSRAPMNDNVDGVSERYDARVERDDNEKRTEESAQDFAAKGARLSNRELIHQYLSRDPVTRNQQIAQELFAAGTRPDNNVANAQFFWAANDEWQRTFLMARFGQQRLDWEPGNRVFDLVPDAAFTEQMDQAKVLLKATASSSTDLIMKMGRYLYGSTAACILNMRAAAFGWMLPVGDHSYWEIAFAAAQNGAPAVQNGPAVYDEHDPMTDQQIGMESPNRLMGVGFRNVLSHVLFPDNDRQRQDGLGPELNYLFPVANAQIRNRVNAVRGNFVATLDDGLINAVVNAIHAPRSVVEQIHDENLLRGLRDFINGRRILNYNDMNDVRDNSDTYYNIMREIGENNADLLFANIVRAAGLADDETGYLNEVSHFLSGNRVQNPDTGLGFSNAELDDARNIVRDKGHAYGGYDRGKWLDHYAITNNLSAEQILALREYTGDAFRTWNNLTSRPSRRLNEVGGGRLAQDLEDVQAGISGIQNLPVYNQGRVYRGESGDIDDYHIGQLVTFQKFLSTGKSYQDSFGPGSDIVIVISNIRTGVDVQLLSFQDQEREVLFPPYARFVVTRVEDRRNAGGDYDSIWVYMNEI